MNNQNRTQIHWIIGATLVLGLWTASSGTAAELGIAQVAVGNAHACALRSDGGIVCWGSNREGQATPPNGSYTQVASGGSHTCALRSDGEIACWGYGAYGQLTPPAGSYTQVALGLFHTCALRTDGGIACWGIGDYGDSPPPAGSYTHIAAYGYHTCALRTDGGIVCWGDDDRSPPPAGTYTQVNVGNSHACALSTDGGVKCWGRDYEGQSTPPAGSYTQVAAGGNHTCALGRDGEIACWGDDDDGQSTPPHGSFAQVAAYGDHTCAVRVDGGIACWGEDYDGRSTPHVGSYVQAAAGGNHSCALRTDGGITCWGKDDDGQSSPPAGSYIQVAAGGNMLESHTCALRSDGGVACWGGDGVGQSTPSAGSYTQVTAGNFHTCALRIDGGIACWGADHDGQSTPPAGSYTQVAAGGNMFESHTCALRSDGWIACWGADYDGQSTPPFGSYTQLAAGGSHTCALRADGGIVCWGTDFYGQSTPPTGSYSQVAAGEDHTCALRIDGGITCWGYDAYGQSTPPIGIYTQVAAGEDHTCALRDDGQTICWGAGAPPILTIATEGQGTVTSNGISCPGDCAELIQQLETITLIAVPDAGQVFLGWEGFCQGTQTTCEVLMNAPRSTTARFGDATQQPPTAHFTTTPQQGPVPLTVTLDPSQSTDPDGDIVDYSWQVNSQPITPEPSPTGPTKSITFSSPGTYTITLIVTDNDGLTDQAQQTVEVGENVTRTLILTNRQKLTELYGATQADAILAKLDTLAVHSEVQGQVIELEQDPNIASYYAARGSNYDDRYLANTLAQEIQRLVMERWDQTNGSLQYLVIVGDDRIVPHYRLIDGTDHADPWTLTDDYYLDHPPYNRCGRCPNPQLFIPDIAGGRLVETPEQIIGGIDTFLENSLIDIQSGAVVAWDFLIDGGKAHCKAQQIGGITTDCTLIGPEWTEEGLVGPVWDAQDLIDTLFNTRRDTAAINLHADYAIYQTPYKFKTEPYDHDQADPNDLLGGSADLTRALYYSSGCHSGQNVAHALDWPEAYAQKRALYIGNTGFGWGSPIDVDLSEKLLEHLSEQLNRQDMTLGNALMRAKQIYFSHQKRPDHHDDKILHESTLYGLPMYRLNTPITRTKETAPSFRMTRAAVLEGGAQKRGYTDNWPLPTPAGDDTALYSLNGDTTSDDGTPILPQLAWEITQAEPLHGIVFRGGSYTLVDKAPPTQQYSTTTGQQSNPPAFDAPGWYPARFFDPHTVDLQSGQVQMLVSAAGQTNPNRTSGQQRVFTGMDFDAYYHADSTDWTEPAVYLTAKDLSANTASVSITTSDASGIAEVVVAYTDGKGSWNSKGLTGSGDLWSGTFAANESTEFFVQAVDGAGNVAVNDNDGQYYRFVDPQSSDCQEIDGKVTIQGPKTYTNTSTCHASNELVNSGEVQVGTENQPADVTYTAGSRIRLIDGFKVQAGSRFRAGIQ